MAIKINSIKVVTEFVDDSTGEIFTDERVLGEETKKAKKTTTRTKKPKDDGDPVAKILLLDNKLQLNNAAIELTGYQPDNKYEVKFEKKGRTVQPIILEEPNKGNRLTKTYTISFRGSRNENLSEYGNVFELVPYEGKEGWFKLIGNAPQKEDDIIDVPEEISNPDENLELTEIDGIEAGDFDLDL